MAAKRNLTLWMVLLSAALAGCSSQVKPKMTPPGGPIIIIQPDPEDVAIAATTTGVTPTPVHQCTAGEDPCWYLGSFDANHYQNLPDQVKGVREDTPKLPHYLHHNAEVYKMEVRLASDRGTPIDISMFRLTLGTGLLEVDAPDLPRVPKWKYGTTVANLIELPDKNSPRIDLSKVLIGKFTAVEYTERASGAVRSNVDPKTIFQIRIYYQQ